MLAALLLAVLGGAFFLLVGRAWMAESADRKLVERLIDLAVKDPNEAGLLLRAHPELLQARYVHDETPLHYCAVEGLVDGVRFLAKAGVPIDAENRFGDTALVDAVALGNLPVVKVLLTHGANPDAASRTHGPVLHAAIGRADVAITAALLEAGARSDYRTELGESIWDAIPQGEPAHWEILKVLDAHGLRPGAAGG